MLSGPSTWYQRADELADLGETELAVALLRAAVEDDVPGAANGLGVLLAELGRLGPAADCFRQAIADGDEDAATNLAGVLRQSGDDAGAFTVLRAAAESGDDLARQILRRNLARHPDVWREIDTAFVAARPPGTVPQFYCMSKEAWRLDLTGVLPPPGPADQR